MDEFDELLKSVTALEHLDGLEANTAEFAIENSSPKAELLINRLKAEMSNYNYGDVPVEITFPRGILYLVRVMDGVYSGMFKIVDGDMQDNAPVRIERMSIPTLAQFIMLKEWDTLSIKPEEVVVLAEKLEQKPIETEIDKRIKLLQLINKLIS